MKKISPQNLKADWSMIKNRPVYHFITSNELAKILGVHLQTINNWVLRGKIIPAERNKKLKGNKNYFKISAIKAWLEGKPELEYYRELLKSEYGWKCVEDYEAAHAMNMLYKDPYMAIHN